MNEKHRVALGVGALVAGTLGGLYLIYTVLPSGTIIADVNYYHAWLTYRGGVNFNTVLVEYPLPGVLALAIPLLFSSGRDAYAVAYVAGMVSLLVFWFIVLARGESRQPNAARSSLSAGSSAQQSGAIWSPTVTWAILVIAMGPIILFRFDLIPALCVAMALAVVASSPSLFAHLVAWGTALKLWPVIVISLVSGFARRWRAWGIYAASGAVFIVASVMLGGWERLFSPLTWQSERGLHTESIAATWIIVARMVFPHRWEHALSQHNSVDFTGPGVTTTTHVVSLVSVGVFVWIGALTIRLWRRRLTNAVTLSLAAVSIIGLFIVTDKVFSPQYMIWILPAWTIVLSHAARSPSSNRPTVRWLNTMTAVLIVATALTQLVYPTLYPYFLSSRAGAGLVVGSGLVAARNVILTLWVIAVTRASWIASNAYPIPVQKESENCE
ncbi:MAG: glycosyltransferase 87 family protein [Actinomycetaceae bacterium]|nr:glycosyltransferase 87 family protein [Actinomycetaceae bacterium]